MRGDRAVFFSHRDKLLGTGGDLYGTEQSPSRLLQSHQDDSASSANGGGHSLPGTTWCQFDPVIAKVTAFQPAMSATLT
jgi:hypothetical protein